MKLKFGALLVLANCRNIDIQPLIGHWSERRLRRLFHPTGTIKLSAEETRCIEEFRNLTDLLLNKLAWPETYLARLYDHYRKDDDLSFRHPSVLIHRLIQMNKISELLEGPTEALTAIGFRRCAVDTCKLMNWKKKYCYAHSDRWTPQDIERCDCVGCNPENRMASRNIRNRHCMQCVCQYCLCSEVQTKPHEILLTYDRPLLVYCRQCVVCQRYSLVNMQCLYKGLSDLTNLYVHRLNETKKQIQDGVPKIHQLLNQWLVSDVIHIINEYAPFDGVEHICELVNFPFEAEMQAMGWKTKPWFPRGWLIKHFPSVMAAWSYLVD